MLDEVKVCKGAGDEETEAWGMKVDKDKFYSLTEKDQNLQLFKVINDQKWNKRKVLIFLFTAVFV